MRVAKAKSLSVSSLNYRFHGQDYLALTFGLGFSLLESPSPGSAQVGSSLVEPAQAMGVAVLALAPYQAQGLILDLGFPKRRGEFLAVAAATPPAAQATPLRVALSVGALTREFAALPEEYENAHLKSFKALELSWAKTEFDPVENPYGQIPGQTQGEEGPLARPQIFEYHSVANGELGQVRPGPASPLPRPWSPLRPGPGGTFGPDWLQHSWPGFPADFDFGFFNLAQEPQRLKEGYFRGDESVVILNCHPQRVLRSSLPGLRLRVVARQATPEPAPAGGALLGAPIKGVTVDRLSQPHGEQHSSAQPPQDHQSPDHHSPDHSLVHQPEILLEAQAHLDTVWLFSAQGLGLALWHAVFPTRDEKNSDISLVVAALEPLSAAEEPAEALVAKAEREEALEPEFKIAEPTPGEPAQKPKPAQPPSPSEPALKAPPAPQAPPAPAVPSLPPALTASAPVVAAVMQESRKILAQTLAEVNPYLQEQGLPPLKMEDCEPILAKRAQMMSQTQASMAEVEKADPAELVKKSLTKGGLEPQEAENVLKAAETPAPLRALYPNQVEFEKAAQAHGQTMAKLLGQPPEFGQKLSQRLIMAQDPNLTNPLALLNPGLAQAGSGAGQLVPPTLDWAKMGVESSQGQAIVRVVSQLDEALKGAQAAPWAGKMAILEKMAPQLEQVLGLAPGAVTVSLAQKAQAAKSFMWGSAEVGKSLETLAKDPERSQLAAVMPQLKDLLKNPPAEANSLVDLGLMAGLTDPKLLAEVGTCDPLNSQILGEKIQALKAPAPEAAAKPQPEPPEPEPQAQASSPLLTREQVIERLRDPRADFVGVSLAGLDLSELDFSGRDLSQADLRECNLAKANLARTKLWAGILAEASLLGADLSGACLALADVSNAKIAEANFLGADLSQANLTGLDLKSVADLGGLKAPGAYLAKNSLPQSLAGADLAGASLKDLDLAGHDLSQANLAGAFLLRVNLRGADLGEADLAKANLENCDLTGVRAVKVKAKNLRVTFCQDLGAANFNGADLTDSLFVGTAARGTSFQGVRADRVNLREADLSGGDWTGSSLKGAVFFRGDLRKTLFGHADLYQAVFGGADLRGTDFGGASLYAADFYRVDIDDFTNFKGADLTKTLLEKPS
ncbi:MAG: pentapeptide repeat-containing protein [Deltaproteobacteria bacterium]|jgi:uncharacterized protein YjbI with pentapeptide repeats|nr:pentapeptide repeat-containing protein [Deltaproteobacteria bacterium]